MAVQTVSGAPIVYAATQPAAQATPQTAQGTPVTYVATQPATLPQVAQGTPVTYLATASSTQPQAAQGSPVTYLATQPTAGAQQTAQGSSVTYVATQPTVVSGGPQTAAGTPVTYVATAKGTTAVFGFGAPIVAAAASGGGGAVSTMPSSEPAGYTRVFAEDFTTAVPLGGWSVGAAGSSTDGRLATTHPYYAKLNLYPDNQGYKGDLGNGRYYTSKTVSTVSAPGANGVLDWYWHSETVDGATRALSGWLRPIVAGETQQNRLGGRFSVRMRADATAGYGAVQLLISDNWPQGGEEDWPEGPSSEAPVHGFRHFADPAATADTSGQYQQQVNTAAGTLWSDWHVYTIEWQPGARMRYLIDGVAVHDSTDRVPTVAMKYVIQSGINGPSVPPAGASGHLQVDWITIADYTGSSGGGGSTSSPYPSTYTPTY